MTMLDMLHPFRPIRRRHLQLMRQVASIQQRALDQSTWLGYVWSFLNPLLLLLVLWAFFSQRVGAGIAHYPVYLLIGIVQFSHVSRCTGSGMRALQTMRGLATSVIFPKEILVYSALLADLREWLVTVALTVSIALISGVPASWALLALPLVLVVQQLLVLWMSLLLAVMYVFVRDLEHLYEVGMRLLFFATPVMYDLGMLSPRMRSVALLNPLTHVIGFSRTIILDGQLPDLGALLGLLALDVLLVLVAIALFRRNELALLERL